MGAALGLALTTHALAGGQGATQKAPTLSDPEIEYTLSAQAQMAATFLDPARASLVIVGDVRFFLDDLKAPRGGVEVAPLSELDLSTVPLKKAAGSQDD